MTARAAELLARMSLREKVGQLNQRMFGWDAVVRDGCRWRITEELEAELERWSGLGALYGLFRADAWSGRSWAGGIRPEERAEVAELVQQAVERAGRHGVRALLVEEAPHGHQALGGSLLPQNLALAATWNPGLVEEASAAVAAELAASGAHVALVSGLDVLRDGRWGRSEETFGEDPLLAAELARAVVTGMQGADRSQVGAGGVAVVLKHLAAQGEATGGRNGQSAVIGERDLHEIHLPPVRAAVGAGVLGLMAAYNDIDGVPCCASPALLRTYLRGSLGFDGIVMADGLAVDRLAPLAGDTAAAGRLALLSGVDLSLWDEGFTTLEASAAVDPAVAAAVDEACLRVLTLKDTLGLLGPAASVGSADQPTGQPTDQPAARERLEIARGRTEVLSRRLARESVVLLDDDGGLLPLDAGRFRRGSRVLVVGPGAASHTALLGDYVPPLPPDQQVSVLDALRARLPDAKVTFLPDDDVRLGAFARESGLVVAVLGGTSHRAYDEEFADNGAAADPRASAATGGEGVDLADVSLPHGQDGFLAGLRAATVAPVVALMVAGRPHVLTAVLEHADATLWVGYAGPSGGHAAAAALFGDAAIGGSLPMTLPRSAGVLPVRYNDRHRPDGVYQDVPDPVLLPFGHGVPAGLRLHGVSVTVARDVVGVRAVASNTAAVRVEGVVQVYAHRAGGPALPRLRELVAFRRVGLAPGESAALSWDVDPTAIFADGAAARTALQVGPELVEGLRPHRG
ncbi:glycoside hydrolase family 3 protein [Promicromonospora panici]|uniref:glycoside hydrolase family 3 protein n=1 Tax=Promicromonospora panici TaxID=2219658 RepID=UPI00101C3E85|nr:glycoside hydrolase family 3 N-terminal domain-containing protein [Promicromonospora panici]